MKSKHILVSLAVGILITSQGPMLAVALADTAPTDSTTTTSPSTTDPSSTATTSTPTSSPTTTDSSTPTDTSTTPTDSTTNTPPASTTTTDPSSSTGDSSTGAGQTGPSQPTGQAPTYAFNDATGKWEPTIISSFTWDPSTGLWQSPFYTYDPVVGWYHVKPQVTPSDAINGLTSGSADPAGTLAQILGLSDPSNSNTGPDSTNNASLTSNNQALLNLLTQNQINNILGSTAQSGDVTESDNTNALGTARSGATNVVANLLNLLNSMWSWTSGGLGLFLDNIFGNQSGDITINPQAISGGGGSVGALPSCSGGLTQNQTTGPDSNNTANSNCNDGLTVNNQSTGSINNDINLASTSGNVNVNDNTNAGNAESGEAAAELNIVNLINTAIGADDTFFGLINIYGNLNGDILFPSGFLDHALGSSSPSGGSQVSNSTTGPGSQNNASATNTNSLGVNNDVSSDFNNNINATAQSGAVNQSGNTSTGSAQSGNATTNNNTFNLFNTGIFGDNAVLVLVNVLGHWMGQIMNLADLNGGSSGALLTGNAVVTNQNTGPDSTNNATANNTNSTTINNTASGTISNDVTATAKSGDVNVTDNTTAGNAKSGDASVASNVANFFGSTLHLSKWFGILIINVFGSWIGDVNQNTAAGNQSVGGKGGGVPLVAFLVKKPLAPVGFGSAGGGTGSGAASAGNSTVVLSSQKVSVAVPAPKLADHSQQASATHSAGIVMVAGAAFLLLAAALFALDGRRRRS